MGTLAGFLLKNRFRDFLQIGNSNAGIDATPRAVEDGEGTASPLLLSTTRVQSTAPFENPDGSVGAPGMAFKDDLDNGFFRLGANSWAGSVGGAKVIEYGAAFGQILPLQSSFNAANTVADLNVTGDGTAFTVICDNDSTGQNYDRNADYNAATGVFTAPVTGIYEFGGIINVSGITSAMTTATLTLVLTGGNLTVMSFHPFNAANASNTIALPWSIKVPMTAADTCSHTIALANGTLVADVQTLTRFYGHLLA